MKGKYEFSSKEYCKRVFPKYLIIYLALNIAFIFLLLLNETLNFVSAGVVVVVLTIIIGFIFVKMLGVKSGSSLVICDGVIKLEVVKFNGTASTRMTIRYDSDVYTISDLTRFRINKGYIDLYGTGEKKEIRRRNTNRSENKKKINSVKIPLIFENKSNIINEIKQIAGGN